MIAPLPENERARLAALYDYRILDSLSEKAYDDITLLASQICQVPITVISLIDRDRQWFKSQRGLDPTATETSRDVAFCAHTILTPEKLLVVPDTRNDVRFANNPAVQGERGIQFYAGAPLVTPEGLALGTLCVADNRPRQLTETQQECLLALARQVMVQLELRRHLINAVDHMALQQQISEQLRESESRFYAFMDNGPIVAFLKDEAGRYVYVNKPFLSRFNFGLEDVLGFDDFKFWPHAAPHMRAHDQSVLAGNEVVSTVETVPLPDGQTTYWQSYKFPLRRGGGEGRFLAGMAVDVTDNKRYEQQLHEYQDKLEEALVRVEAQSLTDSLTGLNNRRAFNRKLDEEFYRAKRYQLPLSLLMMDVDSFKAFNDTFGHPAGDELLHILAKLLAEKARTSDFVARYGGEEFTVILPNTDSDNAFIMAERFRLAVEAASWPKRPITVSIGIASSGPCTPESADLLSNADKALYKSKQAGRNRVTPATP